MINRIIQIILIIFTLLFGSCVVAVLGSDRLYSMSLTSEKGTRPVERGLALIDTALKLTPLDARLYSQKYTFLGIKTSNEQRATSNVLRERQLQLATTCVNLAPSVALNHFRYASAMFTVTPHLTPMAKQYLVSQLQKASILKPYSDSYRDIYEKYRRVWGSLEDRR